MDALKEPMENEPEKRFQCRHIFMDGRRCGSPALRREVFCFYHHTTRQRPANTRPKAEERSAFALPDPEDRSAIHHCIGQILQRIAANEIDPKRAGLLLYGLQTASLNLPKQQKEATTAADIVDEVIVEPEIGPLAPPKETGDSKKRRIVFAELEAKLDQQRKEYWKVSNEADRFKSENLKFRQIMWDAGLRSELTCHLEYDKVATVPDISATQDPNLVNEGPTTSSQPGAEILTMDVQAEAEDTVIRRSPVEMHKPRPNGSRGSLQHLNRAARRAKQRRRGNVATGLGSAGG